MRKYEVETDIDGFIERWLERTHDFDDFVAAGAIWDAMLHSAGLPPDSRHVWTLNRKAALRHLRLTLGLGVQKMRYYRPASRVPGMLNGFTTPCYEQLKLSDYAVTGLMGPMKVQPRRERRRQRELSKV